MGPKGMRQLSYAGPSEDVSPNNPFLSQVFGWWILVKYALRSAGSLGAGNGFLQSPLEAGLS